MTDFSADKLRPALRDAFLLLDRMAGEGLGYDGEGIKLDADDVCLALSEVLGATWEEGPFVFADGATAAILAMAEREKRKDDEIARLKAQIEGMKIELYGVPPPKNAKAISIFDLHKPGALGEEKAS